MSLTNEEIRLYYDQIASERDRWMRKNAYYYRSIERFCQRQILAGARVLEIGSGTGDLLAAVAPSRGLGIDISGEMIKIARRKHPHLEFRQGDIERLTLSETFDYIILSDVVGLLQDVQAALEQLHHAARGDTRLIITYYNYLWEPILKIGEATGLKMRHPVQNWLSMRDLENLLHLGGFEVIRKGRFLLLPKYVPLLSPLVNRYLAPLPVLHHLCLIQFLMARRQPSPMDADELTCSVIIPVRNERGTVEEAVQRIPQMGRHIELIFVEGHSTDDTLAECKRVRDAYPEKDIIVLVQDGKGKGDAVRKGFAHAQGDVLMILDGDLTVPPEELPKFFSALVEGKGEFINGSRLVYPMEKQAMRFLNLLGNKFFSLLFTFLLDQAIRDTLCGTKALFKKHYEMIAANRDFFGDFDPFGDFDLLLGAARLNLKMVEIPIRYRERTYGTTNISRFAHGWLLLRVSTVAMRKLKFVH